MKNVKGDLKKLRCVGLALVGVLWAVTQLRVAGQQPLDPTPHLAVSDFPDEIKGDTDSDLVTVEGRNATALGEVVSLRGRVFNQNGTPVKNAVVEILQCDANGFPLPRLGQAGERSRFDRNFQGFGRCETDELGRFAFRTIKPVPSTDRSAPVIEVRVKVDNKDRLTTVLYLRDHPNNEKDPVFSAIRNLLDRELVQVEFLPDEKSNGGLVCEWDIVVGATPIQQIRGRPELGVATP